MMITGGGTRPAAPNRAKARSRGAEVTMAQRDGGRVARKAGAPGMATVPSTSSISASVSSTASASTSVPGGLQRRMVSTARTPCMVASTGAGSRP
ncbi:hypothetical protein UCD39_00395 [Nitrospirillum sp. BR 11752]|nr:hypothetical protein [Nitrospirillum sp. BR 11752]